MLKLFSTKSYQDEVNDIYRQLERNTSIPLHLFEAKMRRISILCHKINCRSADMGKQKGKYDTL